MPTIPQYESKELPHGNVEGMKIPLSFAHLAPGAALEKAGAEVSEIGQAWNKKIEQAKASHEFSTGMATFNTQTHNDYQTTISSPEFQADPEAVAEAFNQRMNQNRQTIMGGMKSDIARQHFELHSTSPFISFTNAMNDSSRKATINWLEAGGNKNIRQFYDNAVQAPTDTIYHDNIKSALAEYDGMLARGIIKPVQYDKDRSTFVENALEARAVYLGRDNPQAVIDQINNPASEYSQGYVDENGHRIAGLSPERKSQLLDHLDTRLKTKQREDEAAADKAEAKRVKDARDYALKWTTGMFGTDKKTGRFGEASTYVLDEKTGSAIGLTSPEQRINAAKDISYQQQQFDTQDVKAQNKANLDAWDLAIDGKMAPGQIESWTHDNGKRADSATRNGIKDLLSKTEEQRMYHDTKVYDEALRKIYSGEITDPRQLLENYVGKGIDPKTDFHHLASVVTALHNPFMKAALAKFDTDSKNYSSDPATTFGVKALFQTALQQEIDEKGLTEGAISVAAGELMPKYLKYLEDRDKERRERNVREKTDKPKPAEKVPTPGPEVKKPVPNAKPVPSHLDPEGHPVYKNPDGTYKTNTEQKATYTRTDKDGNKIYLLPDGKEYMLKPPATTEQPETLHLPDEEPEPKPAKIKRKKEEGE